MAKARRMAVDEETEFTGDVVDIGGIQEVSMSEAMAEDAAAAAAGETGTATAEKVDRRKGPRGPRPPSMKWPDDPDGTNPKDIALWKAIHEGGTYETIAEGLAGYNYTVGDEDIYPFADDAAAGLLTADALKKRVQAWKDQAKKEGVPLKLPRMAATFVGRSAAPNIAALNSLFEGE